MILNCGKFWFLHKTHIQTVNFFSFLDVLPLSKIFRRHVLIDEYIISKMAIRNYS